MKKTGYRYNAAVAMLRDIERNDLAGREAFGQSRTEAIKEIIRNRSEPSETGVQEPGELIEYQPARIAPQSNDEWPAAYVGPFSVKSRGVFDRNGRMLCSCGDARTSAAASVACALKIADRLNGV